MSNKILETNNGNNFIKQGSILAVASVLSRIIGLLYRSPVAAVIGEKGNGLYGIAFEVYSVALILSSYSMPLAVSKLLSVRFAKREYKNGFRLFKYAMAFAVASGLFMSILVFALAGVIERFSNYEGLAVPLRVLSPTILVVAVAGTLRGFFQSRKTMLPTAVSQLIEQIVNAIISIVAAYIFVSVNVLPLAKAKWGAAGSTTGTLLGAVVGLAFLIFLFFAYKPRMKKHLGHDVTGYTETRHDILKALIVTIIPVILSQAVYQSIGLIDTFTFGKMYTGIENNATLISIYSKYRLMVNVPNAISSALASSMIPTLVALYAVGKKSAFKQKLSVSVKFNMIIAMPCALGLSVLGWSVMRVLYPTTDYIISGNMLFFGSIAVIFYALSTITNAALQGIDRMRVPVINAAISLGIHILLKLILLHFTKLGIYALVIGNITYPLVVCILNWISVAKYAHYKQEIRNTFIIPAVSSIIMAFIVYITNLLFKKLLPDSYIVNALLLILGVGLGVLVYFALLFLLHGLTKEDLPDFPMGMRIGRLAKKLHLLK